MKQFAKSALDLINYSVNLVGGKDIQFNKKRCRIKFWKRDYVKNGLKEKHIILKFESYSHGYRDEFDYFVKAQTSIEHPNILIPFFTYYWEGTSKKIFKINSRYQSDKFSNIIDLWNILQEHPILEVMFEPRLEIWNILLDKLKMELI